MSETGHSEFDERAATWDDDPAKVARALDAAARIRQAVPLQPTWSLLEYGAGTGQVGLALRDAVATVTLADASQGMVDAARQRVAQLGATGVSVVRLDLTRDPLPEQRYDVVVSVMALHHVAELDRLLATLREGLVPGGWLAVTDLEHDPDGSFHKGHGGFHGHDGFRPDELAQRVRSAGLTDVHVVPAGTMTKEVDGASRDFPLFLLTARA